MKKSIQIQKGFTLIEGIMVMLLIVILSSIATSMFSGHKIFTERFFTDQVTQMVSYARKVAMTTECEVEIAYNQAILTLLQRDACQQGEFTRSLPGASLLDNARCFEIVVPKDIQLTGQFPVYINAQGKFYEQKNTKPEKIAWQINRKILNIDPFSGFTYESH